MLIVEDGTGKADAESLTSVAYADAYFTARAISTWTGTTAQKEAWLRLATEYFEGEYGLMFGGTRRTDTQALSFPRSLMPKKDSPALYGFSYWPDDNVPTQVQNAVCELALKAMSASLAPDVGRVTLKEKIDVIEVQYGDDGRVSTIYRQINMLLSPFFNASGANIGLCRV